VEKARFWHKEDDKIRCDLCPRNCLIPEGSVGACNVRKNVDGKLYSLVYNRIWAINVDPIEKKPFFHFHPGSRALSFGTVGCNFFCPFCCNWELSRGSPETEALGLKPEEAIELAKNYKADGLSFTYNEPTIFAEWAIDVMKTRGNLYSTFVTNGYTSEIAREEISKYLDAAVVDFKSFNKDFYRKYILAELEPVVESLKFYYKNLSWLEVTLLYIPKHTNLEQVKELVSIISELSRDIPFHIIRFFPSYKMMDVNPTPLKDLEKAAEVAKDFLNFVYIGNVPGHELENTYCPKCGRILIERYGVNLVKNHLVDGKCPDCNYKVPGIWY